MSLTEALKELARALGFCAVGVTGAEPFVDAESAATTRTAEGLMDGLTWWSPMRAHASADPRRALPDARSVIALAYPQPAPAFPSPLKGEGQGEGPGGRIAAYALGRDYHEILIERMQPLLAMLRERGYAAKTYVDHGWMLDRAAAARAGLGWLGKNTNLLVSGAGSYVLLAEIVTSAALQPDQPLKKSCGTCDACIRARFRQSAVWRTRRSGLLRNVCIALGNIADRRSVPALAAALAGDQPLIRGHAAWALGRLGGAAARNALALALRREADSWVRDECQLAIEECGPLAVPSAGVPPSPLPPAPA